MMGYHPRRCRAFFLSIPTCRLWDFRRYQGSLDCLQAEAASRLAGFLPVSELAALEGLGTRGCLLETRCRAFSIFRLATFRYTQYPRACRKADLSGSCGRREALREPWSVGKAMTISGGFRRLAS